MNNNENNLFFEEEVGGSILPVQGIIGNKNQTAEKLMKETNTKLLMNNRKWMGPLQMWKCISCNRKFEKPLYSHRECPYCGSDLVVLIDTSKL